MCLEPAEAFHEGISLPHVLRLLERKEPLWGHNHGAAQLHWCFKEPYESGFAYVANEKKPSLVMLYNTAGFHFRFDFKGKQYVACDPKAQSRRVQHDLCGEAAYFPRSTFVPIKTAKGVVRKFVREQAKFTRLRWIEPNGFDYFKIDSWREFDARIRRGQWHCGAGE